MRKRKAKAIRVLYLLEEKEGRDIPDKLIRELDLFLKKYAKENNMTVSGDVMSLSKEMVEDFKRRRTIAKGFFTMDL